MKLGLLGFPVNHSLSPKLYQEFLGKELTSYELFSYPEAKDVPDLSFFKDKLDGLNITSPYKTHFINQIEIESDLVRELGSVNTLAFTKERVVGTNTDVIAVTEILKRFQKENSSIELLILGDGVMARLTMIVARNLNISFRQFSRKQNIGFETLDLTAYQPPGRLSIVINACSRDFVFKGKFTGGELFWDYNYSFLPHQNSLPSQVLSYQDGREMLELQAKAAIQFWKQVNPKLK